MEKILNLNMKVSGVTFDNDDGESRQTIIQGLSKMKCDFDYIVLLERDPYNMYDKNAIKVVIVTNPKYGMTKHTIGFVPKEYAKYLAAMIDTGVEFDAKMHSIYPAPKLGKDGSTIFYCEIMINQK